MRSGGWLLVVLGALLLAAPLACFKVTAEAVDEPYEVIVCGENTLPCPPPHGKQVLARFGGSWYVSSYSTRTGWSLQGEGSTKAWPDEWREIE